MPLVLNEEQNMLKDAAKDFCTSGTPISQLRKLRGDLADPCSVNCLRINRLQRINSAGLVEKEIHPRP